MSLLDYKECSSCIWDNPWLNPCFYGSTIYVFDALVSDVLSIGIGFNLDGSLATASAVSFPLILQCLGMNVIKKCILFFCEEQEHLKNMKYTHFYSTVKRRGIYQAVTLWNSRSLLIMDCVLEIVECQSCSRWLWLAFISAP
jgi:hypothetical protein